MNIPSGYYINRFGVLCAIGDRLEVDEPFEYKEKNKWMEYPWQITPNVVVSWFWGMAYYPNGLPFSDDPSMLCDLMIIHKLQGISELDEFLSKITSKQVMVVVPEVEQYDIEFLLNKPYFEDGESLRYFGKDSLEQTMFNAGYTPLFIKNEDGLLTGCFIRKEIYVTPTSPNNHSPVPEQSGQRIDSKALSNKLKRPVR